MGFLMTATDLTEMAMQVEQSGEAFYAAVAKQSQSPQLRKLFEDLRDQEVKHYAVFAKLAQTVRDHPLALEDPDEYMGYLQATIQGALFDGPEKALAAAKAASTEKEAVRTAIGFEKETLLFFHSLSYAVQATDRTFVDAIIAEERSHIRRLAAML